MYKQPTTASSKKVKGATAVPVVISVLAPIAASWPNKQKVKVKLLRVLLDSSSSGSLILGKHVGQHVSIKQQPTMWKMAAGSFKTNGKVKLDFTLPKFTEKKVIMVDFSIMDESNPCQYDMILGKRHLSLSK